MRQAGQGGMGIGTGRAGLCLCRTRPAYAPGPRGKSRRAGIPLAVAGRLILSVPALGFILQFVPSPTPSPPGCTSSLVLGELYLYGTGVITHSISLPYFIFVGPTVGPCVGKEQVLVAARGFGNLPGPSHCLSYLP